jgi:hypothetical protein
MDELVFFSLFGGAVATAIGFAVAWLNARRRADRLEAQLAARTSPRGDDSQIEARVNELATQLDELARSQDFLHRLITKKLDRLPAPVERPREVTPH